MVCRARRELVAFASSTTMVRVVKRERNGQSDGGGVALSSEAVDRRAIRSRYVTVKNLILDEGDDITRADSYKFDSLFHQVESLHDQVHKPREQVADAEALLDITRTLFTSAKSQSQGISVSDFISRLIGFASAKFGSSSSRDDVRCSFDWKKIGRMVANDFRSPPRFCTMIGPMSIETKKRRTCVRRRTVRLARSVLCQRIYCSFCTKISEYGDFNLGKLNFVQVDEAKGARRGLQPPKINQDW